MVLGIRHEAVLCVCCWRCEIWCIDIFGYVNFIINIYNKHSLVYCCYIIIPCSWQPSLWIVQFHKTTVMWIGQFYKTTTMWRSLNMLTLLISWYNSLKPPVHCFFIPRPFYCNIYWNIKNTTKTSIWVCTIELYRLLRGVFFNLIPSPPSIYRFSK